MSRPLAHAPASWRAPARRLGLREACWAADVALYEHARACRLHPLALRDVLAQALRDEVLAEIPGRPDGDLLLGLQGGPRRVVPVAGLRFAVTVTAAPTLCPQSVTLMVHSAHGPSVIVPDVRFGDPDDLIEAAWSRGLPGDVGTGAVEAVLEALGRLVEPDAPLAAMHLEEEAGWELYRFLEVRGEVEDPHRQVGLPEARRLEPESGPGDMIGVHVAGLDWLTPMLWWMGGCA